ncbi:hypothetical protein ACHQM5_003306 [Ranunculus cassubicifolius]
MAAIATSCARSYLRSAVPRLASQAKSSRPSSPFRIPKQNPLSNGALFRSPVELSCCVDSMMPFHTATASALLTSMLSVTRPGCAWLLEGT